MKRKIVNILSCALIILFVLLCSDNVFAAVNKNNVKTFGGTDVTGSVQTTMQTTLGTVLTVVRTVAIGISIIMITYLGIKYMSAAPTEKANIKNQLITFTIGAVIVVGAVSILGIIKNVANNTTS